MKGAKKGFAAVKTAKKAAAASGRRNVPMLLIREDEPPVPVCFNGNQTSR